MKLKLLIPILLFIFSSTLAQNIEFNGKASIQGLIYSDEESPFWLHSNQRGRIDEKTNISTFINGDASYQLSDKASLIAGVGFLYQDGYTDKLQLDESYLQFKNSWLDAIVGRKQKDELYNGLSATNENILWSLNARPLLGFGLRTNRTIYLSRTAGLGFDASIEEFITDDEDRYVKDTRIHHKSFHLVFDKYEKFSLKIGLQHFVEWGGTSPTFGELPSSFNDYIDVFTGMEGDDSVGGQEVNALGNQMGSYEIYLNTIVSHYDIQLLYNHLFDDGSGRVLANTPDGRYGIFIEDQEKGKWVESFIYELFYTKNQSSNSPTTDGRDNYFNNNLYRSGWTYEHRVLGVPFITLDNERFRIANNTILVHHFGIGGIALDKYSYKLLSSYRLNYGAKGDNTLDSSVLSTYLNIGVWKDIIDVNVTLGSDFSSISAPNFGAGIQISKSFF